MNKKTTLLLLGILIALVAAYFAFFHAWNGPDNEFHIADAKAIGKIEIEKMELNVSKTKLTLAIDTAKVWTVNGQYFASEPKIKDFLTTLMEIRVLQPVEPKGQATALSLLKRNHLRVRIWDRDGNALKDYLIGATNSAQTANIFKMGFSDKCYLVSKPALDGYVSIYYSTEVIDWREKAVWNVQAKDLVGVTVTYTPDSAQQSYTLQKTGSEWMLDGLKAEPNRTGAYMELFQGKVFAESFADAGYPGLLDSLLQSPPAARIQLKTKDAKTTDLLLFVRSDNVNSFFAYLNGPKPELMTVQHFVIDRFLKVHNYFMAAPATL
jgi:hypothetical protein